MSFIYRDALSPARAFTAAQYGLRRKLIKSWPHLTTGGHEVLSTRFYYYRNFKWLRSDDLTRFLKVAGIPSNTFYAQDVDEDVEDMWFELHTGYVWDGIVGYTNTPKDHDIPNKPVYIGSYDKRSPYTSEVVTAMNLEFKQDDIVTVKITYGGYSGRYIANHGLKRHTINCGPDTIEGAQSCELTYTPVDTKAIEDKMLSHPWYYLVNSMQYGNLHDNYSMQEIDGGVSPTYSNKTPKDTTMARVSARKQSAGNNYSSAFKKGIVAVLDNGSTFEPIEVNKDATGYQKYTFDGSVSTRVVNALDKYTRRSDGTYVRTNPEFPAGKGDGLALEYSFKVSYRVRGPSGGGAGFIQGMMDWYKAVDTGKSKALTLYDWKLTSTTNSMFKQVFKDMYVDYLGGSDNLRSNGYYRIDRLNAMKAKDFTKLFTDNIDQDHKIRKAEKGEVIAAIVIIVIAIIVTVWSGGLLSEVSLPGLAFGLSMGGLVLTAGGMGLSYFGGASTGGLVKMINDIATVVGYLALILGLAVAYNKIAEKLAEEAVEEGIKQGTYEYGKEVSKEAIKEALKEVTVVDVVMDVVKEAISTPVSVFTGTATPKVVVSFISDTMKTAMLGFNWYKSEEESKMKRELEAIDAEVKELNEANEADRRLADPTYNLMAATELVTTYDALQALDVDFRTNHSPQGFFDAIDAESAIA